MLTILSFRTFYRRRQDVIEALISILWGYTSRDCVDVLDWFSLSATADHLRKDLVNEKMELRTPALLRKILLTLLAGTAFLGVGIIFAYLTRGYDLIILSLMILFFCLFRAFYLWRICCRGTYATLTGICEEITPHPLEQYIRVQVIMDNEAVREIILDRSTKVLPGRKYHFYF